MLPWIVLAGTAPAVLYVSPTGDDAYPGTLEKPLRTVSAALARTRQGSVRRVRLLPGVHRLSEPLVLGKQDSGLVLEGPAVLSGFVVVRGWRQEADGTWSAPAPGNRPIRLLAVDGKIRPRARLPETGRLKHESVFDVPWMSTTGGGWKRPPTDEELTTMKVRAGDLSAAFEPRNAEITVYHMWDESTVGVRSFDPAGGTLVFSSKLGHPPGAFGVQDYVVWNTREGLTRPGQWFHDRATGRLVVRPEPGERLDRAKVEVPLVENLIVLRDANDVALRSLVLEGCDARPQAAGFGAGEAEGAVSASGCSRLSLQNLTVRRVNTWGIRVVGSPGSKVSLCHAEACGAGGIRVDGPDSLVEDCRVRDVGHLYPSAIGLWVGGERSVVRHNHVSDTPYTGILGGAKGMVFEANLIERAMRVLHDGGGIYSGFSENVTIRGNVVRDIADTGGYGAA
ncbi:MAG: right-handed parallel beta-helix repeat-containing protein, partial [Fimbriimonadales bacterium]